MFASCVCAQLFSPQAWTSIYSTRVRSRRARGTRRCACSNTNNRGASRHARRLDQQQQRAAAAAAPHPPKAKAPRHRHIVLLPVALFVVAYSSHTFHTVATLQPIDRALQPAQRNAVGRGFEEQLCRVRRTIIGCMEHDAVERDGEQFAVRAGACACARARALSCRAGDEGEEKDWIATRGSGVRGRQQPSPCAVRL